MKYISIFVLSLGVLCGIVSAADRSAIDLLKSCDEKTQVWNRVDGKLTKVGEKVDGFCAGYLVGTFDILLSMKKVCIKNEPPQVDYLMSVYKTYLDKNTKAHNLPAKEAIQEAYRQAFHCDK